MEAPLLKTFQQLLGKEAEETFLNMLLNGTSEESEEAKRILIERNLRLVAHIAKKYQNTNVDMEDLISIGTIGLIKAVISYNVSKNSKLATYAARCIDNEISLLDIIEQEQPDIIDRMETTQNIRKLNSIMKKVLTEREIEILTLRYGLKDGEEITQREIGRMLGISRSYISRIEKKALEKLKAEFERA